MKPEEFIYFEMASKKAFESVFKVKVKYNKNQNQNRWVDTSDPTQSISHPVSSKIFTAKLKINLDLNYCYYASRWWTWYLKYMVTKISKMNRYGNSSKFLFEKKKLNKLLTFMIINKFNLINYLFSKKLFFLPKQNLLPRLCNFITTFGLF